jgi:hypothetical protein
VENIRHLPRLQALLDALGVRPVYLITYPVSRDPDSMAILGPMLRDGRCEVGSHLHAWTTPPIDEREADSHAYLHRFPVAIQREKLKALDGSISERLGIKPVSYRGGRWALDGDALRLLEEFGYLVDTSVTPGLHWRDGGPDFRAAGFLPYHPSYEDVCRPGSSKILEVPVSIGWLGRGAPLLERAVRVAPAALHLEGITRRLGLLRRVWLRPSLATPAEMIALCDVLLDLDAPVLNLVFHSSELMPGGSPYHATQEDVNRFFERLREILGYLIERRGLQNATLAELGRQGVGARPAMAAC